MLLDHVWSKDRFWHKIRSCVGKRLHHFYISWICIPYHFQCCFSFPTLKSYDFKPLNSLKLLLPWRECTLFSSHSHWIHLKISPLSNKYRDPQQDIERERDLGILSSKWDHQFPLLKAQGTPLKRRQNGCKSQRGWGTKSTRLSKPTERSSHELTETEAATTTWVCTRPATCMYASTVELLWDSWVWK